MDIEKFLDEVKAKWEAFKRYICSIPQNWAEGRRPRAIAKAAIPLTALLAIIAILLFLWKWRYVIGIILFIVAALYCLSVAEKGGQHTEGKVSTTDAVVKKHAIQGRDNLLDIILVVGESLEKQLTGIYTIQCPKSRGQLAYPHIKRCITVKDGVASIAVAFPYTGEADKDHFKERFNDRMCQMLNAYELPGRPNPVFSDKDNVPHTAIQAIHADIVGDRIILEVIRVTQAAIPLLDELDRAEGNGPDEQGLLYDDEL